MKPNKDYYAPMHTAEHILNQTMVRMYDCERSFSNHIERKKSKCDYRFDHELSAEEIATIEENVNGIIQQNLKISDALLSFEEANEQYNLGKIPSDIPEAIRIVSVGDYDACPCIGKHVSNTSEIGTFKISTVSYDGGILRVRYKLKQENTAIKEEATS